MKRRNRNAYPEEAWEIVDQVNIQNARSSEVLELMQEITATGADNSRLHKLLDAQCDMLMLYLLLVEELAEKVAELI